MPETSPETSPDYRALQDDLADLFRAEGLKPDMRGDWVLIDDAFPALRAHVVGAHLHVELALYDGRVMRESFAASGGLTAFRDGPFQVFLSTFWGRHHPGLVARELWKRPDGPWLAIIGPYQREVSAGEKAPVPYLLFEIVKNHIAGQTLDEDLHWLSLRVEIDQGEPRISAQLDMIDQPELVRALARLDWPCDGRTHALRNFTLLARS